MQASLDGLVQLSRLAWGTTDAASAGGAAAAAKAPPRGAPNGASPDLSPASRHAGAAGARPAAPRPGEGAKGAPAGTPGGRSKQSAPSSPHLGWGGRRLSAGGGAAANGSVERARSERDSREAECEKARPGRVKAIRVLFLPTLLPPLHPTLS